MSTSYACRQSGTRNVIEWLTRSVSCGDSNVTVGLSSVGGPPVTSNNHALEQLQDRRSAAVLTHDRRTEHVPVERGGSGQFVDHQDVRERVAPVCTIGGLTHDGCASRCR